MYKEIVDGVVRYVGVNDTRIDLFESQYEVPEGISYNSYLLLDEKVAVLDSVDVREAHAWLKNLDEALGGREPDFLLIQHIEPDHSGSVLLFQKKYPQTKLVCSETAGAFLKQFYGHGIKEYLVVKEGDALSLGVHTLHFFGAPMVHWPEVLVTYESREKMLFSADAFGKFGALVGESLETEKTEWLDEARRYYINIVGKYGIQVQTLLKKAAELDVRSICPLHGPVLTGDLSFYLEKYLRWSSYQPEEEGVVIAYASIYGNTAEVVQKLAQMLEQQGILVQSYDLARSEPAEVVAQAFRFDRMVLACPTYDNGLFPCMELFLGLLAHKNYQKRRVGVMENGTWAPRAGKEMQNRLRSMKDIELLEPVVTIHSAWEAQCAGQLQQLLTRLL